MNIKITTAFFTPLFMLCFTLLAAQEPVLRGRLTDGSASSVNFATVMLRSSTDSSAAVTLTDSTGRFTFPGIQPGSYSLRITAIGFKELVTETFQYKGGAHDLGNLQMMADQKNLGGVTVTALRPSIVQLADRMVVSIEGTGMAQGNTAFSLLSKSPGVFIDADGNIQLNGRTGVTVMMDGRLTYLSARDLRNLLESMPAENIKNIEIITNPSAKYDAEGTAGILNINLKKNTMKGINGSVYTNYSNNFYRQYNIAAGANINFRSGRWNAFFNTDFNRRAGGRNATFTRVFYGTQTTYFDQAATGNFVAVGPPSVRTGADYSFNDKHSIGFVGSFFTNIADQDFLTDTYIGSVPKQYSQYIDADNISTNTYRNFTGNLHYSGKLDTSGTLLSADLDYANISNRGEAFLNNYFTFLPGSQKTSDILYNHTPNGYDIYSARVDFTRPVRGNGKIELGGKLSSIASDNDYRFYFNNNGLVIDPTRTNHFKYQEKIIAGYFNWNGTISKKLSMQAGLRAERTVSKGHSLTTGQVTNRDYTNLFPSVFFQQKVNDNYGINYSYSRRLTRPNYGNLNPFRAYRDPFTWYEGNTQLRPQYTHAFTITQVLKKVYNITFNYYRHTDVMSEIPLLFVEDTLTVYTTGNVNDGNYVSLGAVAPLKIAKKWDSQNILLVYYNQFSMNSNNGMVENNQLTFFVQSNHTILLPREFRLELNMYFRSAAAGGLYKMASVHRVDVAVKKSIFNKKLDLTVNANDIFKGMHYLWTTDINGNVNEFDQYFRLRSVGVALRYNFSKGQKTNLKQRNSIEELNRL